MRLVAAEQGKAAASRFLFESPLIETGTVLLDATQDVDAFALHQQYFHKSVMLLLEHTDGYTKGIILNRPSAHQLEGWRVWFGGDVAEGGFFRAAEPFSERPLRAPFPSRGLAQGSSAGASHGASHHSVHLGPSRAPWHAPLYRATRVQ